MEMRDRIYEATVVSSCDACAGASCNLLTGSRCTAGSTLASRDSAQEVHDPERRECRMESSGTPPPDWAG